MKEVLWPDGLTNELSNNHVSTIERAYLEYLMNEMYEWRDKAVKCHCAQCINKGRLSHEAYWREDHRIKRKPGMDHEGQLLMDYALDRIDEEIERKEKASRKNKKKK
jgi:hypothetical protein